jgi:hypothetical protein
LIIHPSALPSDAGVQLIGTRNAGYPHNLGRHGIQLGLVYASLGRTG